MRSSLDYPARQGILEDEEMLAWGTEERKALYCSAVEESNAWRSPFPLSFYQPWKMREDGSHDYWAYCASLVHASFRTERIRALVLDHVAVTLLLSDVFLPKPGPHVVISLSDRKLR